MSKPKLIVNQPFGLGDIIYIQHILSVLSHNHEVILPVADEFKWIAEYNKNPDIKIISKNDYPMNYDRFERDDHYLPLRYATQHLYGLGPTDYSHDHTVMLDKYTWLNIDASQWNTFDFNYNTQKEDQLYKELGLNDSSDYILVNGNGGSNTVGREKSEINVDHPLIIQMNFVDGYTLFDWRKVVSKCRALHTISTSLVYLADQWCGDNVELFVYKRNNNPNTLHSIQPILTKKWNYMF